MPNPLKDLQKLEEVITLLLIDQGLEVEEHSLHVRPDGVIAFRANILPIAMISAEDFNQEEYDKIFLDLIGDF